MRTFENMQIPLQNLLWCQPFRNGLIMFLCHKQGFSLKTIQSSMRLTKMASGPPYETECPVTSGTLALLWPFLQPGSQRKDGCWPASAPSHHRCFLSSSNRACKFPRQILVDNQISYLYQDYHQGFIVQFTCLVQVFSVEIQPLLSVCMAISNYYYSQKL